MERPINIIFFLSFFMILVSLCSGECTLKVPSTKNIYRPCCDNSIGCVRDWFQKRMECAECLADESLTTLGLYLPYSNITIVQNDVCIDGLDKFEITEFYVNPDTDRILISWLIPSLNVSSTDSYYYYEPRKEPTVLTLPINETISNIEITTVFSNITNPRLLNSESHVRGTGESGDLNSFKACDAVTCNPTVAGYVKSLFSNVTLAFQEAGLSRGPIFASILFQRYICNQNLSSRDVVYLRGPLEEFP